MAVSSHRGSGFGSQYPHGDLQSSVTPIPGDSIDASFNFYRHRSHTWYIDMHAGEKTLIHRKQTNK